jgi:HD-like signal output (HDOD) protein
MSDTWAEWVRAGRWLSADGRSLPLMPGFMRDALTLGLDPDVTTSVLIRRIAAEPQLTAKVLQLANAAASAPRRAVLSVDDAVVRLGVRAVQRAILSACIESWSQPNIYGAEGLPQVEHALGTGCMATLVAELAGTDPDEAFACGLLHDVGKLFLLKSRADFVRRGGAAPSRRDADDTLAECHTVVGDLSMQLWGLPDALREPIRCHHQPLDARTYGEAASVAYVANRLSHRYGFGCDPEPGTDLLADSVCTSMGLTAEWVADMDGKAKALFYAIRTGVH